MSQLHTIFSDEAELFIIIELKFWKMRKIRCPENEDAAQLWVRRLRDHLCRAKGLVKDLVYTELLFLAREELEKAVCCFVYILPTAFSPTLGTVWLFDLIIQTDNLQNRLPAGNGQI